MARTWRRGHAGLLQHRLARRSRRRAPGRWPRQRRACSSSAPGWFSASSSSRSVASKGRCDVGHAPAAWRVVVGTKSTSTPSMPSSDVPDIRPDVTGSCRATRPRRDSPCLGLRRRKRLGDVELALHRSHRLFEARRAIGRRRSTAVPSLRAMRVGSWCWPRTRNSKCRCGPVAQPVAPTAPTSLPLFDALADLETSMRLRCAYSVMRSLPCAICTTLP